MSSMAIKRIFDKFHMIKYIPIEELKKFDADLLTFYNINTPKDYERALLISRAFNKAHL